MIQESVWFLQNTDLENVVRFILEAGTHSGGLEKLVEIKNI